MFAYVGRYTTPDRNGRGDGINVNRADPVSGAWSHTRTVGGLENPSLFTVTLDGSRFRPRQAYRDADGDEITIFHIDEETGSLIPTGVRISVGRPSAISFVTPS